MERGKSGQEEKKNFFLLIASLGRKVRRRRNLDDLPRATAEPSTQGGRVGRRRKKRAGTEITTHSHTQQKYFTNCKKYSLQSPTTMLAADSHGYPHPHHQPPPSHHHHAAAAASAAPSTTTLTVRKMVLFLRVGSRGNDSSCNTKFCVHLYCMCSGAVK